jgi:hypothetical protein
MEGQARAAAGYNTSAGFSGELVIARCESERRKDE